MSGPIVTPNTTTPTPDAGAGTATPPAAAPQTPDAGAQPAGQTSEPFAVFPTAESFNARLQRETRKTLDQHAIENGFENWQAMIDARTTPPPTETPPASAQSPESETPPAATAPETPAAPAPPDEAARLRMALAVATEKGLPPALVARLQGNTPEEMAADADTLLGLVQRPLAGPGIPPTRQNGQTVTFTRAQLRDPAFVREHAAEIQRAAREGRIADS